MPGSCLLEQKVLDRRYAVDAFPITPNPWEQPFRRAPKAPGHRGSQIPRPSPRSHEQAVRGWPFNRTRRPGDWPQGLEDAASVHSSQARRPAQGADRNRNHRKLIFWLNSRPDNCFSPNQLLVSKSPTTYGPVKAGAKPRRESGLSAFTGRLERAGWTGSRAASGYSAPNPGKYSGLI